MEEIHVDQSHPAMVGVTCRVGLTRPLISKAPISIQASWFIIAATLFRMFPPARSISSLNFCDVAMLTHDNHKVDAKIALPRRKERTKRVVVDTGAGPSVVSPKALPDNSRTGLRTLPRPIQVFDANGNPLKLEGIVPLLITIGRCRVKFDFLVCSAVNTDLILGRPSWTSTYTQSYRYVAKWS